MSAPTVSPAAARRAFTLTELLVVIAIISILVALTTVGVMRAMGTARATRIKTELDQMDASMKSFKEKYGAYPPSDLRVANTVALAQLRQFVATAFPRYDLTNLVADVRLALGTNANEFRPDQALVFWLRGFSSDPTHPFITPRNAQISGGAVPNPTVSLTVTPVFEFDTTRLAAVDDAGADADRLVVMPSYFPAASPLGTAGAPYVYWDARSYPEDPDQTLPAYAQPKHFFNSDDPAKGSPGTSPVFYPNAGILVPYWLDTNGNGLVELPLAENWANPDSFQLLSAGNDRKYGTQTNPAATDQTRLYPTGTRYDNSSNVLDDDNTANFSAKARIGDDRP
jgi:prepilin-type N-terminal cleavage/methylation domain-containing protein